MQRVESQYTGVRNIPRVQGTNLLGVMDNFNQVGWNREKRMREEELHPYEKAFRDLRNRTGEHSLNKSIYDQNRIEEADKAIDSLYGGQQKKVSLEETLLNAKKLYESKTGETPMGTEFLQRAEDRLFDKKYKEETGLSPAEKMKQNILEAVSRETLEQNIRNSKDYTDKVVSRMRTIMKNARKEKEAPIPEQRGIVNVNPYNGIEMNSFYDTTGKINLDALNNAEILVDLGGSEAMGNDGLTMFTGKDLLRMNPQTMKYEPTELAKRFGIIPNNLSNTKGYMGAYPKDYQYAQDPRFNNFGNVNYFGDRGEKLTQPLAPHRENWGVGSHKRQNVANALNKIASMQPKEREETWNGVKRGIAQGVLAYKNILGKHFENKEDSIWNRYKGTVMGNSDTMDMRLGFMAKHFPDLQVSLSKQSPEVQKAFAELLESKNLQGDLDGFLTSDAAKTLGAAKKPMQTFIDAVYGFEEASGVKNQDFLKKSGEYVTIGDGKNAQHIYVPSLELELAFSKYLEEEEIRKFGERLRGKKEDAKLDELKYGDMFDRYLYQNKKSNKENEKESLLAKILRKTPAGFLMTEAPNILEAFSSQSKDTPLFNRRSFVNK